MDTHIPKSQQHGDSRQPVSPPMDSLKDVFLVERAQTGDLLAFEELVHRFHPALMGFLVGRLRDSNDADDLGQDIWLYAYKTLRHLRRPDRFGPWLIRIARGKTIDFFRRTAAGPVRVDLDPSLMSGEDTGAAISARQLRLLVQQALAGLNENYRIILYLKLIEEASYAEIALRLGLREGTVRMRVHRGMELLRKKLNCYGIFSYETPS